MRSSLLTGTAAAAVLAAVAMWSCGGGSSYGGSATPTTPSPTPTPNTVTVNIVGSSGNKAYSPNPVQVGTGDTLMFRNNDVTTHHVVMDDGSADFGEIAPGGSSMTRLTTAGGSYHCTIHPTMVGSINGASAPPTPTPDPSGGYSYDYSY